MDMNAEFTQTRLPVAAGTLYPAVKSDLKKLVSKLTKGNPCLTFEPQILCVPDQGYMFTGETAGKAYIETKSIAQKIERVLLLGTSRRVMPTGTALPSVQQFLTPMGIIRLDHAGIKHITHSTDSVKDENCFRLNHSIETQLPFIQHMFPEATITPVLCGTHAKVLDSATISPWLEDSKSLIIISGAFDEQELQCPLAQQALQMQAIKGWKKAIFSQQDKTGTAFNKASAALVIG